MDERKKCSVKEIENVDIRYNSTDYIALDKETSKQNYDHLKFGKNYESLDEENLKQDYENLQSKNDYEEIENVERFQENGTESSLSYESLNDNHTTTNYNTVKTEDFCEEIQYLEPKDLTLTSEPTYLSLSNPPVEPTSQQDSENLSKSKSTFWSNHKNKILTGAPFTLLGIIAAITAVTYFQGSGVVHKPHENSGNWLVKDEAPKKDREPGRFEWGEWSVCDVSCGQGKQIRNRGSVDGGSVCGGGFCTESRLCNQPTCPPCWPDWGQWSVCDVSCGEGKQTRSRRPNKVGTVCEGSYVETRPCYKPECPCFGEWSEWGPCTCEDSTRKRKRERLKDKKCQGIYYEALICE